ncbi:S9 family peptidase [Halalkalibacillus halophilus]|uniref:S9 family peptidase n=1 Tax=Halalkalibacillus halophilus TaxID=392827 RepID=UPI000409D915|nr:S9 family peptidase [Halalkalibacillus halophilus]
MTKTRKLEAEDLYRISSITDPRIAPNGKEAVFIETTINESDNKYYSCLNHLDLETNNVTSWTHGKEKVSQPRWSNDGRSILFLSNRENEKNQVYIMSTRGGEAKKVTDFDNGVVKAAFSPDDQQLAIQTSVNKEHLEKEEEEEEKNDNDLPTSVVINRMKYKADGAGVIDQKFQQIYLYDLKSEKPELLLKGNQNFHFHTWTDEQTLIYSTDEVEDQDFEFNLNVYVLNVSTNETKEIPTPEGAVGGFAVSPDQSKVLFVHMGREFENATHAELMLYDFATGVSSCLTEEIDSPVGDFLVADIQQQAVLQPVIWSSNFDYYFAISNYGNVHLYYGNIGGEIYPAWQDVGHVYGFDIIPEQQTALLMLSTPTNPGEIFTLDVRKGITKQITSFHDQFVEEVEIVQPEPIQYESSDQLVVHGWLMKPASFKEQETYPLVVNIHGGPHAFYGNSFFHEMQYIASKGYAVLYTNPRGSHSYGQSFVDAVRGNYGQGDYEDIMNGVDYVLNQYNWVDESRLGVTGGSYGGFMTNWIVGHTNRFKAAVTQRSISNWISFRGVSDIGYYFTDWQIQVPFNDVQKLWDFSPIKYVDQVETPLLITHNEKDFRCPMEQAEQLFIALKYQGKETSFVRFPDSDHNLSRTGKPNLRIERLNHIVDWFEKYL